MCTMERAGREERTVELQGLKTVGDAKPAAAPGVRRAPGKLDHLFLWGIVLVLAACAGCKGAGQLRPTPGPVGQPWALLCPLVTGGASLAAEGRSGGAVLLVAVGAKAEDAAARLERFGEAVTRDERAPRSRATANMDPRDPWLPLVRVNVLAIGGGARAELEAVDPDDAGQTLERLQALLDRLRSGGCQVEERSKSQERRPARDVHRDHGHALGK